MSTCKHCDEKWENGTYCKPLVMSGDGEAPFVVTRIHARGEDRKGAPTLESTLARQAELTRKGSRNGRGK